MSDSKAPATVDDISVIVIPVYQYYKEFKEWETSCVNNTKINQQKMDESTDTDSSNNNNSNSNNKDSTLSTSSDNDDISNEVKNDDSSNINNNNKDNSNEIDENVPEQTSTSKIDGDSIKN
jgi:hypothetical protein